MQSELHSNEERPVGPTEPDKEADPKVQKIPDGTRGWWWVLADDGCSDHEVFVCEDSRTQAVSTAKKLAARKLPGVQMESTVLGIQRDPGCKLGHLGREIWIVDGSAAENSLADQE